MPRVLSQTEIDEFRDRLCDAATRQFAEHGIDGVTMRALANEVGVSHMTPYRYFRDKEDILAAVQARAFDRFADALEAPFNTPGNAASRSTAVSDAYIRFALDNPSAYRLMFELPGPCSNDYPELERAAARARDTMTRHVKALVDEGIIEGDPELIGHVFWATIHGAVMLKLANKLAPECDFDRICNEAFRALGQGFLKRG